MQRFVLVFAGVALWIALFSFFERKIEVRTGDAAWIWAEHELASREPVAFAAVGEFEPPADRVFAHLLVAAHPEYALYLNGTLVGAGASGRSARLDRYEVGPRLKEGTNRVVVVARSKDGVGGVLATVDFGPDRRNAVVTPDGWRITRNLAEAFTAPLASMEDPRLLGKPPAGAWNVPELHPVATLSAPGVRVPATSVTPTELSVPEITVLSGVAVMTAKQLAARVFDFGEVRGRILFERNGGAGVLVVPWRTANVASEIGLEAAPSTAVFGEGETAYVSPEERSFRYVIVYDPAVEVALYRRDTP